MPLKKISKLDKPHNNLKIDIELELKLKKIKELILKYLFDDVMILIKKWENNEKIPMTEQLTKRFKFIFMGDWNRQPHSMGLDLTTKFKTYVCKKELVEEIQKELQRKSDYNNYAKNANPNIFFLCYKEFFGLEIMKVGYNYPRYLYFKPETLQINGKENIVGIRLYLTGGYDSDGPLVRFEIIKSIEFHSYFLLDKELYDSIGEKLYVQAFIEYCTIQYNIDTKEHIGFEYRAMDQVYQLPEKSDNLDKNNSDGKLDKIIKLTQFMMEFNEVAHKIIADIYKNFATSIVTKQNTNEIKQEDTVMDQYGIYKNLLLNFSRFLFKLGYEEEAIILHMVKFSNFGVQMAKFGVELVNEKIECTLSNIFNLPFFSVNEINNADKIIQSIIPQFTPEKDFKNWSQILSKYSNIQSIKKLDQQDIHCIIILEKDNIQLTINGVDKFLTNIDIKDWSQKDDFFDYIRNMRVVINQTVKNILNKDNDNQSKKLFDDLYNCLVLKDYSQEEYFEIINTRLSKLKTNYVNPFHPHLPFLIKFTSKNEFVDYKFLKLLVKEKYLNKLDKGIDYIIEKMDNHLIQYVPGYKLIDAEFLDYIYTTGDDLFEDIVANPTEFWNKYFKK